MSARGMLMTAAVLSLAGPAAGAITASATTVPTGQSITPLAAPGAIFQGLNPHLPTSPDVLAGQASAVGPDGENIPAITNGYVLAVFGRRPVQRLALQSRDSFLGRA